MSQLNSLGPVMDNFAADAEHNFSTFFGLPETDDFNERTKQRTLTWTLPAPNQTWKAKAVAYNDGSGDLIWWPRSSHPCKWQSLHVRTRAGHRTVTLSTALEGVGQTYALVRTDGGHLECKTHCRVHLFEHCPGGCHLEWRQCLPSFVGHAAAVTAHRMPHGMFAAYYRPRYCPVSDPTEQPLAMVS